MSLYSQMKELRPLPTQEVYRDAFALVDESFGKDGSWGNVVGEFAQIPRDKILEAELLTLSEYGNLLQESELHDKDFTYDAPRFLVGRAFAQGFSQQLGPSQLMYSDKLTRLQSIRIIHAHYAAQNFKRFEDADEIKLFNSQYICALGQYGLSIAGEEAGEYINKWAADAYPMDERLATAFKFGHGAMILSGIAYQSSLNDQLMKIGSQKVNLDEEVASVLVTSSGEDK